MRKLDNSRVEGFVKKHVFLKRWISVMLVVALLVTCTTMYALNKAASAVSEETADDVGMVLSGTDEEGTTDDTTANETDNTEDANSSEAGSESDTADDASSKEVSDTEDSASTENSEETTSSEDSNSEVTENENTEQSDDASTAEADTTSEGDQAADSQSDSEADAQTNPETEQAAPADDAEQADGKDAEDAKDAKVLSDTADTELTEDVVLTVSYVNEANEPIDEEREIKLSDSLDFTTEAPAQEGYEFKQAAIDGNVITKITAKLDANEHKYYEVTLANAESTSDVSDGNAAENTEDANVIVIKENKTVVLTYTKIEASKTEYVFENEKVRVVATLEKASAIPDDAEFVVTELTSDTAGYDYDAYMKALNNGEESTLANHNELNTILYDIAFMVDKKDESGNVIEGEKVEYQPEEGSVSIKFEFLDKQLEDLSKQAEVAEDDADKAADATEEEKKEETSIEVTHMPLNEEVKKSIDSTAEATDLDTSDINTVAVEAQVNTEGESVEMSLDNFSVVSMSTMKLGADGAFIYDRGGRRLTYKQNTKTDAFVDSEYYNGNLALGIAGNFHVVAFGKAEFVGHVNGNVLAEEFSTNADFGTRNIDKELSYIQKPVAFTETMASKENHTLALGNSVEVGINNEDYFAINGQKISKPFNIIQDKNTAQNPYIDIEKVKQSIKSISDALAATTDGAVLHGANRSNNSFYRFTYAGDGGAGYLNLKGSKWNEIVDGKAIEFVFPKSLPNQAIIINIDCSDVSEIKWPTKASDVFVNGTALTRGETPNVNDGRIVYNFVNAQGKNITASEVFGQIIAIGAHLEVSKGDGNFIADSVKISGETHRRDFIGTTTKSGSITISGTKRVGGEDVPPEYVNGKFEFQIDKYDSAKGWVKIGTTFNDGNNISFDVTNSINNAGKYYFRIHEVIPSDDKKIPGMTYDTRYYLADVDVTSTTENTEYGTNIRYSIARITYHVANYDHITWSDKAVGAIVFDNIPAPKTGMLRIHKMVVNDYGSDFVRNRTGSALLSKVTFRITNNNTKNYIVVYGFTDRAGESREALEYDADTHKPNGNTYTYTYNQSAQWTIQGLTPGEYTVEEVADGYTFSYEPTENKSYAIESNILSRVTKYAVTVDAEENRVLYGTGGNNYRKVFSKDVPDKQDKGPDKVKVGEQTQTVQVCNYYSIPVSPIEVAKNFVSDVWPEDISFTFKLEPIGYSANVSEGESIELKSQPMPMNEANAVVDTVTVTAKDITKNENGIYSAVANFGTIPFRYEGTYYYKITEENTGSKYVTYDTGKAYYVRVIVKKDYTYFSKEYTYKNMTHPEGYTKDTTLPNEDFFYLGADVAYSDKEDFSNILATCTLTLGTNPDTVNLSSNEFIIKYTPEDSIYNVVFTNVLKTGKLDVTKVWTDSSHNQENDKYTSLTLEIWQRLKGTSKWTKYGTTQLSPTNNWHTTVTELPLIDKDGKEYEYCVKESDEYVQKYEVTYTYNGATYSANTQTNMVKVDGKKVLDPGYTMKNDEDVTNFGEVTVTNRSMIVNTLPAAGGMGSLPFAIAGAGLASIALIGMTIYRRKRDEE